MNKVFLPICALSGAALAAGLSYLTVDRPASGMPMSGSAIMIADFQGAPGDGNTSLRAAFRTMLENAGIQQVETLDGCTLAVSAEVSTLRLGDTQKVSIVWQVHDANGDPLGEVSQLNKVAYGALDNTWGTEASLAARGARDGIVKIMQRPRSGCT